MDAEARLRWLQKLASEFPGETPAFTFWLTWENAHCQTGVVSYQDAGIYVFLQSAQHPVESLEEAVQVLRRIFADELVCVTAYARDSVAHVALAEAGRPSASFGTLDGHGSTPDMPQIESLMIETWSSGLVERG